MDREKVIKGLECHQIDTNHRINCADCPYYIDDDNHIRCVNDLHDDTLELLNDCDTQLQYRDDHIAMYQAEIKRLEALLKEHDGLKHYDDGSVEP